MKDREAICGVLMFELGVTGVTASVHVKTDRGATHEDDGEGSQDASNAHQPGHPEEKDHPQDVLHTWQVHAHYRAHTWSLSIKQSTNQ